MLYCSHDECYSFNLSVVASLCMLWPIGVCHEMCQLKEAHKYNQTKKNAQREV